MCVAFFGLQVDGNFECCAVTLARIQRRQELLDQEWLEHIRFQIVIGLNAIFCKAIECQCCFGWLLIIQIFDWCIAIEAIFEDKGPAPFAAGASNIHPAEVVEEYQATDAFVELVPGPQKFSETLKVFVCESITVVRNRDFQCVRLVECLHINIYGYFGRTSIQRIGKRFKINQCQRRVGEKQPDGPRGFNVHCLPPLGMPPDRAIA